MADILHRISIDADPERVRELVSTKQGVEDWWTAHPVGGTDRLGGTMLVYFGGSDPAAAVEVIQDTPERVVWRCVEGPSDWKGTEISFRLDATAGGGTTLLFAHAGWRESSDFMANCSTNWGAYLTSLKKGAEGSGFAPYPAGEISRWS
jgi:uncharacterized protein YndB with AHSA1/START domain